jgi:uncharacterized protein (TIGR02001 family)
MAALEGRSATQRCLWLGEPRFSLQNQRLSIQTVSEFIAMVLFNRAAMSVALSAAALVSSPVFAQDKAEDAAAPGPIAVAFSLSAVSDYRFRGVSLSSEKAALQPSITLTHDSGFSLGLWGSNIADNGGDNIEIDATLGYSKEFGSVTANAGAVAYLYPGAKNLNYGEVFGGLKTAVGPGHVGANVAYAPKQKNIGNKDNIYYGVTADLPLGELPVTLVGSFGIENGAFGNNKRDWSAGADFDIVGVTAGVRYIDTARTTAAGSGKTIVVSLTKSF